MSKNIVAPQVAPRRVGGGGRTQVVGVIDDYGLD